MSAVSVDLGIIKVAGKNSNLSLTLASSFLLQLPPSWTETPTANTVHQASRKGEIWISKAGSCQFEVLTFIENRGADAYNADEVALAAVADLASECKIWKHLGLELHANHASPPQADKDRTEATYFLHHPDLSSGLIVPSNVPSAQFQGLRCELRFRFPLSKTRASSSETTTAELVSTPHRATEVPSNHTYHLRSNPKLSQKAAVTQEDISIAAVDASAAHEKVEFQKEDEEPLSTESLLEEMGQLLNFGFQKLIGIKSPSPGMRTMRRTRSPSLIDIAPAVWNLRYLQTMSVHAQVITSIASGISQLQNAQSESLREKVNRLACPASMVGGDGQHSIETEVQKRLWQLCQTHVRPEPIKGYPARRGAGEDAVQQGQSQTALSDWELAANGTSALYAYELRSDSVVVMDEHELISSDEHYSQFPETLPEPQLPGLGGLLQVNRPSVSDTDEPWSGDELPSSEGDYFYVDGQGNAYTIREQVPGTDELPWLCTPESIDAEELEYDDDEDQEVERDEDANEECIMYHEMQHWHPVPFFDDTPTND